MSLILSKVFTVPKTALYQVLLKNLVFRGGAMISMLA